ncbi:MAG: GNAT family N-acetyltransferase [Candidatus Eremiobacteraeota bacterium]|nr:GNAT family N-acetyltransferase [Candidatus Eremiobacteraeota bacterium]
MNAGPVAVRRATERDIDVVAALFSEYFDELGLTGGERDDAETIRAYLADPCAVFLVHVDEHVAGAVALRPIASRPGACEIKRLYVRPLMRGHGAAAALLDALEALARESGYADVYLDSLARLRDAIALYRKRGYRDCKPYHDHPEAQVFMRRSLS